MASLSRSPERRKHESDSSFEDPGQAYVVGQHKQAYLLSPVPHAPSEVNEVMLVTNVLFFASTS